MKTIEWEKIKVVSWDIDGTLYDLHEFMAALKRDLFIRALTLRWWSLVVDLYRLIRFKVHMDKVRKMPPDFAVGDLKDRERIGHTMDALYGRLLPSVGRLEGVTELLDWVAGNGRRQVVFSDYQQSTKLTALSLQSYFEAVYAGEDLGHLKPSPQPFRKIIEDLGVQPDELLHIGDRMDTDGAAAQDVGFQAAIIGVEFASALDLLHALQQKG